MMTRRQWTNSIIASMCLSLSVSACTSPPPQKKVDLTPVEDAAPYWCQLVPKSAVNRVTSVDQELQQDRDIDIHNPLTLCEVGDNTKLPLEVQLALDSEARLQAKDEFTHNRSEARIPQELGRGIFRTAPEAPNYTTAAEFHCGKRMVWLRIGIRPVAQGRDPVKDLTDLLRIAEKRYADLAHCTIKP